MKSKIIATVLIAGLSSSAWAAMPKADMMSKSMTSALELLRLPGENRRMAIQGQEDKFYQSFIDIAFNEQQPMTVRWHAVMAAAESRGEKATADLLKAGNNSQWFMRNAALVALQEVNPAEAQRLAMRLVKDKALVVRSASVDVLNSHMTAEVRDLLWEELNKSYNFKNTQSLWIRHQIVEVLAKKPTDHEMKIFAQLLTDSDTRVQLPAVAGLEKLTGTKLGEGKMKQSALVGMWKNYLKKENVEL